jgi:hypothetical protein
MNDIETRLNKLAAWQYLNVANFFGIVIILGILIF